MSMTSGGVLANLTVFAVLLLACVLGIAYLGSFVKGGGALAVLQVPRSVKASAVQSELAPTSPGRLSDSLGARPLWKPETTTTTKKATTTATTTTTTKTTTAASEQQRQQRQTQQIQRRRPTSRGRFFNLSERPKDAHLAVSSGERAVPIETPARLKGNPWWKSVRIWRGGSAKPTKRQKMVLVSGLPRSGTTLMDIFLRLFDKEMSPLIYPKKNHIHEGADKIPFYPLPAYGGSGGGYERMCGADDKGELKNKGLRINGKERDGLRRIHEMRRLTFTYWGRDFNFSMPLLFEKDPRHMLRMRLWQEIFGDTHDVFPIFTMMHPLEIRSSLYPCNPNKTIRSLIVGNWLNCHRAWLEDLKYLRNYLVIPYEAWFLYPDETARAVEIYLNVKARVNISVQIRRLVAYGNEFALKKKYFARCSKAIQNFSKSNLAQSWPGRKYVDELATYGYDLFDSTVIHKPSAFGLCKLDGAPCP